MRTHDLPTTITMFVVHLIFARYIFLLPFSGNVLEDDSRQDRFMRLFEVCPEVLEDGEPPDQSPKDTLSWLALIYIHYKRNR